MKNLVIFLSVATLLVAGIIMAQKKTVFNYEKQWQKIEELAEKQLPESALKELEVMLKQAQSQKNAEQTIKALVYKMRFTLEKEPDKAPELIKDFESYAEKTTDKIEKSLLYSMTADLYAQYYQNNLWTINKRTEVAGFVLEDIKEWTKNIFYDKITVLLDVSVLNSQQLQKTDALKFEALLEPGNDSRKLQPTLFDFLAYRKVDIMNKIAQASGLKNPLSSEIYFAPANEFINYKSDSTFTKSVENKIIGTYQQLIAFHSTDKNPEALIYADLQRLQYVKNTTENNDLYLKALNNLEQKYKANDFVVEILAEKAEYYMNKSDETAEVNEFKRTVYDICGDGIKRFPNYKRIDLLKNIQKRITQKSLNVSHNEVLKPASNLVVNVNTANITALQIKTYRINATALEYFTFKQNRQNGNAKYPNRTLLETTEMKIKADPNFRATDTTITLKSKEYGIYEMSVAEKGNTDKEKVTNTVFVVSDFGFMQRVNVANMQNLYVLDRQTGLQQAGVQVNVYQPKWTGNGYSLELKSKSKSDNEGLCKIPFSTNYYETKVFFERGKDVYFSTVSYANFQNDFTSNSETPQLDIFTDRSIYRPGQTVYFKGIAFYATKNRNEIVKSSTYEVTLYDANNQKVSSKTFKTNEFGSFSGEFVLPDGGLNGQFRIQTAYGSQFIWVEEYKRPTFEVTMEKPKTEVRFGEKVNVKGVVKAYAGYNIGDAKVNYRVTRNSHRYCWWWSEPATEIATGTAVSDADGKFEVSFVPENPITASDSWRGNFYTYTISADVTDPKGETQQGEQSVSLGDKSLFIIATVPDKMDKNTETKIDIYTETLNGERLNSVIDYEVYRMAELTDYIDKPETKVAAKNAEKVASGQFNTSDKSLKLEMKKWKSAQYKLVLKTKDAFGSEVKTENIFVLYSTEDKRPPVKSYVWLLTPKTSCAVGEKAEIRFGTSTKNTAVLYEIMQGNTILESKWLIFNDEIKTFEIPFKEAYGAGVNVHFTFMKDEKFFSEQVQLTRKVIEKKLTPALSVFRNKLLPGEKAEWTITIPETVKDKKAAELLVGMYDASLD
ncbi:MAG TPA: MG2 domain-containing protein, partial [Paludibacter sp.]|nr:MG2 domain-containing protein [Paludibacter sp.]